MKKQIFAQIVWNIAKEPKKRIIMIIRFEYCPILGLRYWIIEEFNPKTKTYGKRNLN